MEDKFNFYSIIIVGILALVFMGFMVRKKDHITIRKEIIGKQQFSGIVTDKYIDKQNHNEPIIVLSNENKISLFDFWTEIEVNDSVVKKEGSLVMTVYKKKDTLVLDYNKEK